jgi:hypothetical protein
LPLYRQGTIFEAAAASAPFLAGLGTILTCACRPAGRTGRFLMGPWRPAIVLFGYVGGMILLAYGHDGHAGNAVRVSQRRA